MELCNHGVIIGFNKHFSLSINIYKGLTDRHLPEKSPVIVI